MAVRVSSETQLYIVSHKFLYFLNVEYNILEKKII